MTNEEIYNKYIRLAASIAQKMAQTYDLSQADVDDMVASAGMKMIQIKPEIRNEDVYIRLSVRNFVIDELRVILRNRKRLQSYDNTMNEDQTFGEFFADPATPDTILQAKQSVQDILSILTDEEKEIVQWVLGLNGTRLTLKAIARRKRRGADTIGRIYHQSLDKMRQQ